jgi:GNAT superfamily N-acetyltransferase
VVETGNAQNGQEVVADHEGKTISGARVHAALLKHGLEEGRGFGNISFGKGFAAFLRAPFSKDKSILLDDFFPFEHFNYSTQEFNQASALERMGIGTLLLYWAALDLRERGEARVGHTFFRRPKGTAFLKEIGLNPGRIYGINEYIGLVGKKLVEKNLLTEEELAAHLKNSEPK